MSSEPCGPISPEGDGSVRETLPVPSPDPQLRPSSRPSSRHQPQRPRGAASNRADLVRRRAVLQTSPRNPFTSAPGIGELPQRTNSSCRPSSGALTRKRLVLSLPLIFACARARTLLRSYGHRRRCGQRRRRWRRRRSCARESRKHPCALTMLVPPMLGSSLDHRLAGPGLAPKRVGACAPTPELVRSPDDHRAAGEHEQVVCG